MSLEYTAPQSEAITTEQTHDEFTKLEPNFYDFPITQFEPILKAPSLTFYYSTPNPTQFEPTFDDPSSTFYYSTPNFNQSEPTFNDHPHTKAQATDDGVIPEVRQRPGWRLLAQQLQEIFSTTGHQCLSGHEALPRLSNDHVHSWSKDTDIQDSCRPHNVSNPHPRKLVDDDDRQTKTEARSNGFLRSYFGRRMFTEPDIEQGKGVDCFPTTSPPSSGSTQTAKFLDPLEMISRRFVALHAHVLKRQLQDSQGLENTSLREDKRPETLLQHQARKWLLSQTDVKLSTFNSMILSMDCLKREPKPRTRRYRNIKDYLFHGPPIPLDHSEILVDRWTSYKRAVKDLLKDPKSAHWLNGPMFGDGNESQCQQWHGRDRNRKRAEHTQWTSRARRGLELMARGGEILFWISHITAALSYVLVTNSSGPKGHPLVDFLLGYWYISAVSIVVRELLSKGYVYARKVLLGAVLACLGGYYTLVQLLSVSASSAFTATPIFFTIVVLLIRAT